MKASLLNELFVLLYRSRRSGYVELVHLTFEDQCELQRRIRDLEEIDVVAPAAPSSTGKRGLSRRTKAVLSLIHTMKSEGKPLEDIARATGLHRHTIRRLIAA